tara:strand:+ start:434 stop:616 length:183 start_codon:yes stop_codon:yes gene_type:complete
LDEFLLIKILRISLSKKLNKIAIKIYVIRVDTAAPIIPYFVIKKIFNTMLSIMPSTDLIK